MDYIKIRLTDDMGKLSQNIDKTIEEMFRTVNPMFTLSKTSWKPQMDLVETAEAIIIMVETAGVKAEDLSIEVDTNIVRISGKRPVMTADKECSYRLAEIQYGAFERILPLPALIHPEKVEATYKDGFMTLNLPKQKLKKTVKINITEG